MKLKNLNQHKYLKVYFFKYLFKQLNFFFYLFFSCTTCSTCYTSSCSTMYNKNMCWLLWIMFSMDRTFSITFIITKTSSSSPTTTIFSSRWIRTWRIWSNRSIKTWNNWWKNRTYSTWITSKFISTTWQINRNTNYWTSYSSSITFKFPST